MVQASSQEGYAGVEIRILGRQSDGYPVRITIDGQQESARDYLSIDVPSWSSIERGREAGVRLFELLFADRAPRSVWDAARGQYPRRRIRLRIDDEARELHDVPWELLVDPGSGSPRPLAISPDTPFFRYVASDKPPGKPILEPPIKLLVAIANPRNLSESNLSPFDTQLEQNTIREAVADLPREVLQVTFLSPPVTLEALDAELRKGYHLLHLISHSHFDERRQQARLFLVDREGMAQPIDEEQFGRVLLRQKRSLQFVFFAGAETARIGSETRGFALEAINAGTSAALGIRDRIPLSEVRKFTRTFYHQLFQHGQVDVACNEARYALSLEEGSPWKNWVLAGRFMGGRLIAHSALERIPASRETEKGEVGPVEQTEAEPESSPGPPVGSGGGAANDEVAQEDYLNFEHYVEAFARLIGSKDTDPPLTIGIFGSWGMGKSFLLQHIERRVQERSGQDSPQVHVISFNAWEYSANEAIWPGLVRKIMQELERQVSWRLHDRRVKRRVWRNFKSQVRQDRAQLIIITAALIALIGLASWQFRDNPALAYGVFATLGISGLIGIIKQVSDALSEPLSRWVTVLFQEDSGYGKPIDYMTRIREDLEFLGERLRKNERVLVLIDDLDRCEPDKAVEVLQAIKLLLNFKQFIVCLGIDARVVTRAIEKHYEGLLGPAGASGYEYLDKIVQIPFRIPEPNPDEIREFINKQMGEPIPPLPEEKPDVEGPRFIDAPVEQGFSTGSLGLSEEPTVGETPEPTDARDKGSETEDTEQEAFVYTELKVFQSLARFLQPNPRHIKRLLNVYRLVRTLADLKQQPFILNNPAATIRWLVLCAQWPYTAYAMLCHYREMLEDEVEDKLTEWPSDDPLDYLYKQAKKALSCEKQSCEKQRMLDYDLDLLRQLLDREEGRLSWDQLKTIRQYTINFNPAVETEMLFEASAELAEASHSDEDAQPAEN